MYYRIVETPGRREVDVKEELGEDYKINTQDIAKIVVQQLRAKAKKEKRKVDYAVVRADAPGKEKNSGSGGSGTSIRLSEEQRRKVAKVVGRHMMETGDVISMGDAISMMIDELDALRAEVARLHAKLEEEDDD